MKEYRSKDITLSLPSGAHEFTLGMYVSLNKAERTTAGIISALSGVPIDDIGAMPAPIAEAIMAGIGAWLPNALADCATPPKIDRLFGRKLRSMGEITLAQRAHFLSLQVPDMPNDRLVIEGLATFVGHDLYGSNWLTNIETIKHEVANLPAREALGAFFYVNRVQANLSYYGLVWWSGLKASIKQKLQPPKKSKG